MKNKKRLITAFIIFWGCLFSVGLSQEKNHTPEKKQPKKNTLVRKDLLFTGNDRLRAPRRNIFSPTSSLRAQVGTSLERVKPKPKIENVQKTEKLENVKVRPSINLRYIGYIRSESRIVALVLFRGEAWAVEKGEMLDEEIKVEEVSIEELVLTIGGFQPLKFMIEGETQ